MKMAFLGALSSLFALTAVLFFCSCIVADPIPVHQHQKRALNQTELSACQALSDSVTDSHVYYPLDLGYTEGTYHFMTSSAQTPTCVFSPTTAKGLATGIKLIGQQRINFAVECGGHASNQGFSSTSGIHVTLDQFTDVSVAADKSYVDIGGGSVWQDVYSDLEDSGVNVVGGRVSGIGAGGFITGGGGFSWKTNQHGVTADTLIQADMVLPDGTLATASADENSDLWWAIRGGGNQFGVIYNFRLKAYPQAPTVYAGERLYTADQYDNLLEATYDFAQNNKDPLAQVIPTLNCNGPLLNCSAILLGMYDGDVTGKEPFAAFDKAQAIPLVDFREQTFASAVSGVPSHIQGGHRGAFHSVNVQNFSMSLLKQIKNQTMFYGAEMALHSGAIVSYDIEPFLPYAQYTLDAPWPHSSNGLPLNLYFGWDNEADDEFWRAAMDESVKFLADQARAEGQNLDDLYIYPNYALAETPPEQLFGDNLGRLQEIKQKYDPDDVMGLTTYFPFE